MRQKTLVYLLPVIGSLALIGCGSGSSSSTTSQTSLQPGQKIETTLEVNGVAVESKTYTVYGVVDTKGTLVDKAQTTQIDHTLPHVVMLSASSSVKNGAVSATKLAQYRSCYNDFWASMQTRLPGRTTAQITQRLNDFNMTIDQLCDYQTASGLTVDGYVELFQVVEKYWPDDPTINNRISRFFADLHVSAVDFKATLLATGFTWDDFVKRIAAQKSNGSQFINEFASSNKTLGVFLRDYMTRPVTLAAIAQTHLNQLSAYLIKSVNTNLQLAMGKPVIYAQVASTSDRYTFDDLLKDAGSLISGLSSAFGVVEEAINIGQVAWDFLESKSGTMTPMTGTVSTYVLSSETDPLKYEYAKNSRTQAVRFTARSFFGDKLEVCTTDVQLSVDYGATLAEGAGQWMPDIRVLVKDTNVPWGWTVTGHSVVSYLKNRGSEANPVPEVGLDVALSAKRFATINQSLSFTANAATGAAYLD